MIKSRIKKGIERLSLNFKPQYLNVAAILKRLRQAKNSDRLPQQSKKNLRNRKVAHIFATNQFLNIKKTEK